MPLDKTVALVIKLMDRYHIRVGSDEYAKENESYGLTTLQNGHFKYIKGTNDAFFKFTGKSGKEWKILVKDNKLVELKHQEKLDPIEIKKSYSDMKMKMEMTLT